MQLISSETNALMDVLKKTAPGTALREGLDNVLRANTGEDQAVDQGRF